MSSAHSESNNSESKSMVTLPRQRLADQIAEILREQILLGKMAPGSTIHERETSTALGVSRTPLREAILLLEADGLVETSPSRSPIVANPDVEELIQLLTVQAELEALAGSLACQNATDSDLETIRSLYQKMVDTEGGTDTFAHFKTDMEFHHAIVNSSGNLPLIKTHKQYNSRLWRARFTTSSRRLGRKASMSDHLAILQSLERRSPKDASRHLRQHLERAIAGVLNFSDSISTGSNAG